MSAATSPSTGFCYGVERVCHTWDYPRSSYYQQRKNNAEDTPKPLRHKRGPKTALSDTQMLALVKDDLAASPWIGEGHRKVWARLKFVKGIRVSRKRILRLMRENKLLSPHRFVKLPGDHTGEIGTNQPNEMWGADGTQVLTVDDGKVWIFTAIEHWNAECVGYYVCKRGDRFNALQPVSAGVLKYFGSLTAQSARGLSLRHDHGSAYTSDHFQNQIKFWGITPSFAFVRQPETNGIAERFFRTLKEQIIYGRIYRNLEEVRQAVQEFVELYNDQWRIEKNGFLTPKEMRQNYLTNQAA